MSKTVLIVEKDLALMKSLRDGLQERGFSVDETTDGKGAPELIRKKRPDAVVLAVDLDAGQNGYIICKKLKSDAELKTVPVVIIGDPKGFESHQKLKTRAEDYVGKPFEVGTLVATVGSLVGFPAAPLDDAYLPTSGHEAPPIEEISLESVHDEGVPDPDFEMVDSMFEEKSGPVATEQLPPPFEEDILITSGSGEQELPSEKTVVNFLVPPPEARRTSTPPFQSSASGAIDPAEARELRARVTELTGSLDEARSHASELDNRVRELEAELEARQTELETARTATSKGESKEVFALRDAANKKDKEILKLKNELNAKEQEIVELRDKENTLEQQASESSSELAKREAQLKTLQSKTDQLTTERKRVDQQLTQAREEGRASNARLSTLQADFDALHARAAEVEAQLEPLRQSLSDSERLRGQAEGEVVELRGEVESLRQQLEERQREHDEVRSQREQTQADLDATRSQLTSQASSFADEISGLRQRLADTEAEMRKHEDRASRHQARVKAQQDHLERLRASLQTTMQTLEDGSGEAEEVEIDELAEA